MTLNLDSRCYNEQIRLVPSMFVIAEFDVIFALAIMHKLLQIVVSQFKLDSNYLCR
jgi:hypothetical protein